MGAAAGTLIFFSPAFVLPVRLFRPYLRQRLLFGNR